MWPPWGIAAVGCVALLAGALWVCRALLFGDIRRVLAIHEDDVGCWLARGRARR